MIPAKLIPFISPDPSLRAIVHREQIGPFQLIATLTRFGGLCVTVWEGDEAIHQGENVIIARLEANRAMDSRVLERTRIALAAEGGANA